MGRVFTKVGAQYSLGRVFITERAWHSSIDTLSKLQMTPVHTQFEARAKTDQNYN